jgi:serpin B
MQAPTFDLSQPLQQLGMTDAFDPSKADFLGMCSDKSACTGLYVGFVLQKATIDVAENGVEAAAATAVGVEMSATENPTIVNLTFDRPFMVSLVDSSGAILLLGQVDDPTATGG